jgi:signal transduction histidine kinase
MGSKKLLNYHWRLFLPLLAILWVILAIVFAYNYQREKQYRYDSLERQLIYVNASIIAAYDRGGDLQEFVEFIDNYISNTVLSSLRITVYDAHGNVVAHNHAPLILLKDSNEQPVPEWNEARKKGIATNVRQSISLSNPEIDMFNATTSTDGMISSLAATPYNVTITQALTVDPMIWVIIFMLATASTILGYMYAHHLSKNVYILRDFANRIASGEQLSVDGLEFPNDELGDVSRRLVALYRDKDRAMARSEHEHEVALRATEEQARTKRRMTNNLNHELKTPVGIIKGYLDTICADPTMPEALRNSFMQKAQQHADRLANLLQDVSALTRLDDGTQHVETTDFDFHDLVANVSNDLDVSHINGELKFTSRVPKGCFVRANYSLILNALMNLVRNAANYSHGNEITLLQTRETPADYVFSFADNGVGVPEEHIPHLFDRFYRVDDGRARKSGGAGLGLPIVQSTILAMGGHISVQNAHPHGLEFIFTLPKGTNPESL